MMCTFWPSETKVWASAGRLWSFTQIERYARTRTRPFYQNPQNPPQTKSLKKDWTPYSYSSVSMREWVDWLNEQCYTWVIHPKRDVWCIKLFFFLRFAALFVKRLQISLNSTFFVNHTVEQRNIKVTRCCAVGYKIIMRRIFRSARGLKYIYIYIYIYNGQC